MARIRALKEEGGRATVLWTPKKGGRPPALALWEVTVSVGKDSRGRYRQRSERIRGTLTQAKAKAAEMEVSIGGAGAPEDTGRTLGEAMNVYIAHAETVLGRAGKTIVGYRSIARTVASRIGSVKLRRLNADDLDGYYTWLRATREVSGTTVAHHHMLISQTLNMAIRRRWIVGPSPAASATAPGIDRPKPSAPTVAEAQLFIRALASKPETNDKAALLLLAGITSCRRGEVVGWRWSDFDRESGGLTVQRAISIGPGGPEERRTKTKRERRLAVDAKTIAVLATQWDRYASACRDAEIPPDWDSYVFSGRLDHSAPLNPNSVTQAFRRLRVRLVADMRRRADESGDVALARQAARLEQIKLGQFRHFGATQMGGAGIDVKTASARLGNDGAVFLRHYAGVIDAHDQAAGVLLSSLLMPALDVLPAEPEPVTVPAEREDGP